MKCQLLFVATVCLVTVWALPVPDEEVAIQPDAGTKAELLGKTVQTNPIEPAPFKPEIEPKPLEPKIDAKTVAPAAAAAAAATPIAALESSSAAAEPAKTELKLSAPDVETAPAIPEKVNAAEEVKPIEKKLPAAAAIEESSKPLAQPQPQTIDTSVEPEKKQEKAARTEEEPIEAPKAIPLVEAAAPAANAEVQKQVVDEVKSQEPKIDAKSAEVPAAIAPSSASIDEAEKDVSIPEKQPARQERISEIEQKDEKVIAAPEASLSSEAPAAAPALPTAAPAEAAKTESNIQVITPIAPQPEKKSIEGGAPAPGSITPAAAPAALAAQAKSAEPQQAKPEEAVKSVPELAAKETEQPAAIAETVAKTLPQEQNVEKVPEWTGAKKIDEAPVAQPIAAAPLPTVAEPKKSSEEKSESKNEESSESKESDESSESKENVSN
ncbi:protein bangles and beads [Drosophila guanche]|uniref:Blast:Protein bangles and beads n=1 Tax=Drosophila guanche TaxID=7266 RepID=A0A3B0JWB4_DROGU|nr:protein bangles and beads [Drosophila guanche]SPP86377.1 blast:Protein bangles and beads [Drosophila guanche]